MDTCPQKHGFTDAAVGRAGPPRVAGSMKRLALPAERRPRRLLNPFAWLAALLVLLAGVMATPSAQARDDDDPPGRAGRIAELRGDVQYFDEQEGQWVPAVRNRPVTSGDRFYTESNGRMELRVGSTTFRLGPDSELEVLRLDDERLRFQLHAGNLAVRVRSRDKADELQLVTEEARFQPLRSGHYRIDRLDDTSYAAAWRGSLRVQDREDGFTVETGRRAELWRARGELQREWVDIPGDEFGDWVARADREDERSASRRYVSPEMTGAEDLDRHGRWDQHPEYGAVWTPTVVVSGWAPYRHGRWVWVRPWGWTWVDEAPWGFAPFHYGRWVYWRDRWCWTPGQYVARPVYAPALVAWVGGSHWNVSVSIGGPVVGWVPLAPREVFVPYYRHSQTYVDRVNVVRPGQPRPVPPVNQPIMYANQKVQNAVTVVPRDVLQQRQPVQRSVIDLRDNEAVRRPLPVQREAPVQAPPQRATTQITPAPGQPIRVAPGRQVQQINPGQPSTGGSPGGTRPQPRDDGDRRIQTAPGQPVPPAGGGDRGARDGDRPVQVRPVMPEPRDTRPPENRSEPRSPEQRAPEVRVVPDRGADDRRVQQDRERAQREQIERSQREQREQVERSQREQAERQRDAQERAQRDAQQREAQQREAQQREAQQREREAQQRRPTVIQAPNAPAPQPVRPAPQQERQERQERPQREEPRQSPDNRGGQGQTQVR
jgi:hypothetical protein